MNELKEYAACLAESLAYLNERVAERQSPTRTKNMGFNQKKCKSCRNFDGCHSALNRTPQDILAIIEAGYVDKVCYTEWAAGMYLGHITQPIEMVQIKSKGKGKDGECVFFHDGKCDLHESGLKPTEGRLSHHDVSVLELRKEYNLTYQVAIEWCKEENLDVIREIVNKVMEHLNKKENE